MDAVAITRVINPCALIEIGHDAVLTDPYFVGRGLPMHEQIGLRPDQLPPLTAILGGHGVFDHWQPRSLRSVAQREQPAVLVGNDKMARGALAGGVHLGRGRGSRHDHDGVGPSGHHGPARVARLGFDTTAFLLTTPGTSVYVSTEAADVESVEAAADRRVDIAVLPIDGLTLRPARRRLVMDAATALEATRRLGAHTLMPIHYSQRAIPGLLRPTSGIDELVRLAGEGPTVRIVHGRTGERAAA